MLMVQNQATGAWFWLASVGELVLCRGYHNGVGYIGFVAGGCDLVTCKGGLVVAKNAKKK